MASDTSGGDAEQSIYLVSRSVYHDDSYPLKAFATQEDAEQWRDSVADTYETRESEYGNEYLVGEMGTRFNLTVKEVEWGSDCDVDTGAEHE